jgi:hypothetical protein
MFSLKEAPHANHALFVRMFVRVLFVTETRCGVVMYVYIYFRLQTTLLEEYVQTF